MRGTVGKSDRKSITLRMRNVIDKAYFKLERKYMLIYIKVFENLDELDNF